MNKLDFNIINGFPINQDTLNKLQMAFSLFNAFGSIVGDKTIISGCTLNGTTVADGAVFVNGELFEFRGGLVQAKVSIKEDITNLIYKNGNSYPAVKTRYVTFGSGLGAMDWADFKRGFETKEIVSSLLAKADKSSFDALAAAFTLVFEKMLTIDVGAEKNVQADLNEADETKDSFVKGKGNSISALYKGVFEVSDPLTSDAIRTVNFPSVGTNNYMVVGCMVSKGSNYDLDNDVIWMVREKTNTSFKLTLREVNGAVQNLSFEYILVSL